jgi:hypothetical protein
MKRTLHNLLVAGAVGVLGGCMVLPKVDMNQPVPCPMVTREVTLDVVQLGHIGHCYGDACLLQLTAGTVIFAASALVSGSVALVGNTLHWIERAGKCANRNPAESETTVPVVSR